MNKNNKGKYLKEDVEKYIRNKNLKIYKSFEESEGHEMILYPKNRLIKQLKMEQELTSDNAFIKALEKQLNDDFTTGIWGFVCSSNNYGCSPIYSYMEVLEDYFKFEKATQ